jgi:hypothetical protein
MLLLLSYLASSLERLQQLSSFPLPKASTSLPPQLTSSFSPPLLFAATSLPPLLHSPFEFTQMSSAQVH